MAIVHFRLLLQGNEPISGTEIRDNYSYSAEVCTCGLFTSRVTPLQQYYQVELFEFNTAFMTSFWLIWPTSLPSFTTGNLLNRL